MLFRSECLKPAPHCSIFSPISSRQDKALGSRFKTAVHCDFQWQRGIDHEGKEGGKFTFTRNLPYIAFILFTLVKFTRVRT